VSTVGTIAARLRARSTLAALRAPRLLRTTRTIGTLSIRALDVRTLSIRAIGRPRLRRRTGFAATVGMPTAIAATASAILMPAVRLVLRHRRYGSRRCQQQRAYHGPHPALPLVFDGARCASR
jgi:hypothetical protein